MRAAALLAIGAALLAVPALSQTTPPAPAEPMEEIIVEGQRPVLPTFQEEWEFQQMEFERLRKRFEPPNTGFGRVDRMTGTPNPDKGKSVMRSPGSATVQGRPTPD